MPARYVRRALTDEVWHLATDGEGLGATEIARELREDVELIARVLAFEACEVCQRRDYRLARYRHRGPRRCDACYAAARRYGGESKSVPVAPLAEAMRRLGTTPRDVAIRLGWMITMSSRGKIYKVADGPRVRRYLGLREESGGGYRRHCHYETAVKLARAIGVDPVDVEL